MGEKEEILVADVESDNACIRPGYSSNDSLMQVSEAESYDRERLF